MKRFFVCLWCILLFAVNVTATEESEKWIFLADTHIAENVNHLHNKRNVTNNFQEMTNFVLRPDSGEKPDWTGIVITGDLAAIRGTVSDYKQFKKLLSPFFQKKIPVYPLLGNHDEHSNLFAVFPDLVKQSEVEGKYAFMLERPFVDFIFLDSKKEGTSSDGDIGEEQMKWLTEKLTQNPEKPAIIFAHHPPFLVSDRTALTELLRNNPRVKAFVFGHTHSAKFTPPSRLFPFVLVNLLPLSCGFDTTNSFGYTEVSCTSESIDLILRTGKVEMPENNMRWTIPLKASKKQ
ncbi:MAG: metallophosphoesterase family protein [Thermoguttaceae bacterium]